MDYRTLGRSGCAVSSVCLGTMTFGTETGQAAAHQQLAVIGGLRFDVRKTAPDRSNLCVTR